MVYGTPGYGLATWEHTPQNGGNATLSWESTPQKRTAAITAASAGIPVRGIMCGVKGLQDGRTDVFQVPMELSWFCCPDRFQESLRSICHSLTRRANLCSLTDEFHAGLTAMSRLPFCVRERFLA